MKPFWKRKSILTIAVIVLIGAGYYFYQKSHTATATVSYVMGTVEKGTITSSVTGTGQVAVTDQLDIKPLGDGQLTNVSVKQGDQVKAGDTLAIIDQRAASDSLAQARASLQQAQANYQKVMQGTVSSDLQLAELSVKSAQQNLDNVKNNYTIVKQQQDLAVAKAYSNLLNTDLQAVPSDTMSTAAVTVSGNYTGQTQGSYTVSLYNSGDGLHYNISGLSTQTGLVQKGLALALGNGLYITFATTGTLYANTSWTIQVPNTVSSSYQNNMNAYTQAQQSESQALQQAQNSIASAQNSLEQATIQLQQKQEPATAADIASAQAQVASARSQLSNAQTAYENTVIKAPFDGIIATFTAQKGDQVSSNTTLGTLISHQAIAQITLNEVDAAKIKVGQKTVLTFPAITDLSLTGQVGSVDAVGTVSQNVVNFTVKIYLDTQNDQVKPGMSVSASIITDIHQDILYVPSSAVKSTGGQSYIQTMVNGKPQQLNVTTGLVSDTDTEISGDVKEGDSIITQTITSAAKTTTQTSTSVIPGLGGGSTRAVTGGAATFRAGN